MAVNALLIEGVSNGLKYIENDLAQVERTFDALGIRTQRANAENAYKLRERIGNCVSRSCSGDTFILFYSGHGEFSFGDFCLHIANTQDVNANLLDLPGLIRMLSSSLFSKIIIILDCCHAEAAKKAISARDHERINLYYASRTLQQSYELDNFRMSAFSKFFCDVLADAKAGKTGLSDITLQYVDLEVRNRIHQYNQDNNCLIPDACIFGAKPDEAIFGRSYKDDHSRILLKINNYFHDFLHCINNCSKTCIGDYPWCNILYQHGIEIGTHTIPRVKTSQGKDVKLDIFFRDWFDSSDLYLALLADAGMGKTSACLYLIKLISGEDEKNSMVPIFIPLQRWEEIAKQNDVYQSIHSFSNKLFTLDDIKELIRTKQLVILLDGFDEITSASALQNIIANFRKLSPFLRLECKTILTCRTHYFAEENQISDVLQGVVPGTEFAELLIADERPFEIAELQEFSEDEILDVIHLTVTEEDANSIWIQIKDIYDLEDLAKRPIILKMILGTLPQIKSYSQEKRITISTLYKLYTYKLLKKEFMDRKYQMDISDLEQFIEYIASLMWSHEMMRINSHDFRDEISSYFMRRSIPASEISQYIYAGQMSSFFIRDKSDNFQFCHKSFFEYYYARYCLSTVGSSMCGWNVKWFDKEIAAFIVDMIQQNSMYKFVAYELLKAAGHITDQTMIWNVLHILSLLEQETIQEFLTDKVKKDLLDKAEGEKNCVIIRQYCRIIAKFINRQLSEELIDRILKIVREDSEQNQENNQTYINYYGGKDAACNAFIKHLQAPSPKYDARLHIYLLGDMANSKYVEPLVKAVKKWPTEEYKKYAIDIDYSVKIMQSVCV